MDTSSTVETTAALIHNVAEGATETLAAASFLSCWYLLATTAIIVAVDG